MDMNYQTVSILEILLENDGKVSVEDLLRSLKIGKRPMCYHLSRLNDALKAGGFSLIRLENGNIILDLEQKSALQEFLKTFDQTNYIFSKDERRQLIFLHIILSKAPVTIDYLCQFLVVSRNTVLAEISDLRMEAEELHLQLTSNGRLGYRIIGDEQILRYYSMDCFYRLNISNARKIAEQIMMESLLDFFQEYNGINLKEEMRQIILSAEQKIHGRLNYNSIEELLYYLMLIALRNQVNPTPCLCADISTDTQEYQAAGYILGQLNKIGISISLEERSYLAAILLGSKLYTFDSPNSPDMCRVMALTESLVVTFEQKAFIHFDQREELVQRLTLHVRAMYYRLKYKIKVHNILADTILMKYREIYNLTDLTVKTVEDGYHLAFPKDEIAYLCIYFGSWIRRQNVYFSTNLKRILVVCGAGIGTSLLIKQQLQNLLGPDYIYDIKDLREMATVELSQFDLVVTTVSLTEIPNSMIRVNPIFTNEQEKKLLRWSISGGMAYVSRVQEAMKIVERHAIIQDEKNLLSELRTFLGETPKQSQELHLLDLLTPQQVQYCSKLCSYEEAIRISCHPLEKSGLITASYAEEIIALINQLGCYAEFREEILLAHAQPGTSTIGTGVALTVFAKPVLFKQWNKKYRIIFTLCSKYHDSHFPAIKDLMRLLYSESACQAIKNWPKETLEELYPYIATQLSNRKV